MAADLGLEVTLIDERVRPGGVCLYEGCIPSKALLHVADLLQETRHAAAWGIEFGPPKIDLEKLRTFKQNAVGKLTGGLSQISKQRKVQYLQGRAVFVNSTTLRVTETNGGQQERSFDNVILATGSRPASVPGFPSDNPRVMDSTGALELKDVPRTLLVVGGGYIGLELGSVYASLGSKVTVVEMMPGILPGADRDLVNPLAKRLDGLLASVLVNTKVVEMKDGGAGIRVRLEGPHVKDPDQVFERVLVSVGRKPNSEIPGLENTGVTKNQRGFLEVDLQRRTKDAAIYAIGDVVGEPMLAHKASHEGRVAAEAIAGKKVAFEPHAIPAVVFTDPEIAWCGLTETEAEKQGREITVSRFPWAASGRAATLDRSDGVTKLIVDP